tara:strand:+ start:200 stop:475 length:276 start_codon:yes stop_codon:yes gene_type:complete
LKKNEKILLGSWLLMIISILLIVMTLSSCNGGWTIAGVDISPTDSIKTDFMIITDQDSTKHWYIRTTTEGGILVGDNWCHRHERWEKVEKK